MSDDFASETAAMIADASREDPTAIRWLVAAFSPILLATASRRIGASSMPLGTARDHVLHTWAVFLAGLAAPGPPMDSPREVLRRLSAVQAFVFLHAVQSGPITEERSQSSGAWSSLGEVARETVHASLEPSLDPGIERAIRSLDERDRDILQLRGIDQLDDDDVASLLDLPAEEVRARYRATLAHVVAEQPGGILGMLWKTEDFGGTAAEVS